MEKDYAKRNYAKQQKHPWIIYIIVAVVILFPILLFSIKYREAIKSRGKKPADQIQQMRNNTNKQTNPVKPNTPTSSLTFDFYTLLPKMAVALPTINSQNPPPALPLRAAEQPIYVLQLASLHNNGQAEKLRDALIALGHRAFIQRYTTDHITWYRVLAGPYLQLKQARQQQANLQQEKLDSLLLKMKLS